MVITAGEQAAIDIAKELARTLGHAAVVVRKGKHHAAQFRAADSWHELDRGWTVTCFVSSKGTVALAGARP